VASFPEILEDAKDNSILILCSWVW